MHSQLTCSLLAVVDQVFDAHGWAHLQQGYHPHVRSWAWLRRMSLVHCPLWFHAAARSGWCTWCAASRRKFLLGQQPRNRMHPRVCDPPTYVEQPISANSVMVSPSCSVYGQVYCCLAVQVPAGAGVVGALPCSQCPGVNSMTRDLLLEQCLLSLLSSRKKFASTAV